MHSSSVVQTCCGPVVQRGKKDSIPPLAAVGPRATRLSQRLCRTFVGSSIVAGRPFCETGGLWFRGVEGPAQPSVCDLRAFCCLLPVVCCLLYYLLRLYRLCCLSTEEARSGRQRTAIEEEQDEQYGNTAVGWIDALF